MKKEDFLRYLSFGISIRLLFTYTKREQHANTNDYKKQEKIKRTIDIHVIFRMQEKNNFFPRCLSFSISAGIIILSLAFLSHETSSQ